MRNVSMKTVKIQVKSAKQGKNSLNIVKITPKSVKKCVKKCKNKPLREKISGGVVLLKDFALDLMKNQ